MTVSPIASLSALARRKLELQWAADDERAVELTAAEKYARDPIGWINDHVVVASFLSGDTHDRQRIRAIRMRLFPQQEQSIAAWIDLDHLAATGDPVFRNVAAEKSRQIGETVGFAATIEWLLQHHRVTGLCMHLKLEKIDDGGPSSTWESLFGKIRYIDRHLDRQRMRYAQPLVFRQKPSKIENPLTGAVIHGKGQEDDPGRGDSLDFALVDEAAKVQHGELVHQSLASACPDGKVYLSTPFGDSNMHARICDTRPAGWTYLRLHWSEHPVYSKGLHVAGQEPGCVLCEGNRLGARWTSREPVAHRYPGKLTSPWYDREVNDKTDEQVAAEYDIDREGSLTARVYPGFDTGVHVVEAGVEYDPGLKVELAVDYGLDTTSIVVLQDAVDDVRVIGLLEMGDQHGTEATPPQVADQLRLYLMELGVPEKEARPEFTRYWRAVGDPAGHARSDTTGRPFVQQYRRQGFNFGKPPSRLTARVDFSIISVKLLLSGIPKPLRVCGVNAAEFARHMRNNTWKTDALGRPASPRMLRDDVHNHACRAFAYWCVATFPPPSQPGATQSVPHDDPEPEEHPLTRRRRLIRERHGLEPRDGVLDPGFGPTMTL